MNDCSFGLSYGMTLLHAKNRGPDRIKCNIRVAVFGHVSRRAPAIKLTILHIPEPSLPTITEGDGRCFSIQSHIPGPSTVFMDTGANVCFNRGQVMDDPIWRPTNDDTATFLLGTIFQPENPVPGGSKFGQGCCLARNERGGNP
ncbi:hypothetical protein AA103581_0213 [Gluconobacter wancherniae NBRC 103581]|nr:hypothetical protein AA103581_0213 [Gluconobacter wancherniae NBRC 103581]